MGTLVWVVSGGLLNKEWLVCITDQLNSFVYRVFEHKATCFPELLEFQKQAIGINYQK